MMYAWDQAWASASVASHATDEKCGCSKPLFQGNRHVSNPIAYSLMLKFSHIVIRPFECGLPGQGALQRKIIR